MCGKETIVSDEYGHKDEKDQHEPGTSNMIVEQIDGIRYPFDTADCALMFKKFSGVYGRNFADEQNFFCS
jgi:hypothetical protein